MKYALRSVAIGLLAIAASPAGAADWWLVSGVPSDQTAVFADVETLVRDKQLAQVRILRVDRSGSTTETVQQIQCHRGAVSAEQEIVRKFACASDKHRERYGLILASMSPIIAAQLIFDSALTDAAQVDDMPRT